MFSFTSAPVCLRMKVLFVKCFVHKAIHFFWIVITIPTLLFLFIMSWNPGIIKEKHESIQTVREFTTGTDQVKTYWNQNRRYRSVSELDLTCNDLFFGNTTNAVTQAKQQMKANPRPILGDFVYFNLAKNCTDFKLKRGYVLEPLTQEAAQYPLAYGILFYKDLAQVERLLRAIYRPNNIYCLHLDAYSTGLLLKATQALVSCFDNVFLASNLEKVIYAGYSRLQADINCMEESLNKDVPWKYYINLASQAFPLKTNEELVKILKIYNGSNIINSLYGDNINPKRFMYKVNYTTPEKPGQKPQIIKGKTIRNPPPPHNITLLKGSAYGAFSRELIKFTLSDKKSQDFLDWSRDTFSPDEHFWASINSLKFNPHLKTPGGNLADPHKTPSVATHIGWRKENCKSGRVVRLVCIFGVADLQRMRNSPSLFANKFYLDFEYLAMDCLEELLWNRTRSPANINTKYYQRIANLQMKGTE